MKTATQLENIARGMRRIRKATEIAWAFNEAFFECGYMSYFTQRFKSANNLTNKEK